MCIQIRSWNLSGGMRNIIDLQFIVTDSKCYVTIVFRRSQGMSVGVVIKTQSARQKNC
jgi:hypothetical protein